MRSVTSCWYGPVRGEAVRRSDFGDRAARRWRVAYVAALASTVAGTGMVLLAATTVTTTAATSGSGGSRTAVFLALMMIPGILAPVVPSWGSRFGEQRTAAVANALSASVWLVAGLLVVTGSTPVRVVYAAGLLGGFPLAVNAVYKPLVSKAFLTGEGLAMARAYQGVIGGVAFALGSLAGGAIVNGPGPGWAMIANAVLTAPIAVVCWFGRPARPVPAGRTFRNGWAELRALLRRHRSLRLVLSLVSVALVCIGPFTAMAVPITAAVRNARPTALPGDVVSGAAILMAAVSSGRILAPYVVRKVGDRVGPLVGLTVSHALLSISTVVFSLLSLLLSGPAQLVFWAFAGLGIGTSYYSATPFLAGAIGDAVEPADQALGMASLMVVAAVMAPVGVAVWGVSLDRFPVTWVLVAGGVCLMIEAAVGHRLAVAVRNADSDASAGATAAV